MNVKRWNVREEARVTLQILVNRILRKNKFSLILPVKFNSLLEIQVEVLSKHLV